MRFRNFDGFIVLSSCQPNSGQQKAVDCKTAMPFGLDRPKSGLKFHEVL